MNNAAALPRCRALPTVGLDGQFVQVGGCFRCRSIVGKDIAAAGRRRRFEPTWRVASRRAESRGRLGDRRGGARTMIGGALHGRVAAGQDHDRGSGTYTHKPRTRRRSWRGGARPGPCAAVEPCAPVREKRSKLTQHARRQPAREENENDPTAQQQRDAGEDRLQPGHPATVPVGMADGRRRIRGARSAVQPNSFERTPIDRNPSRARIGW
jgi:hypothetical protein